MFTLRIRARAKMLNSSRNGSGSPRSITRRLPIGAEPAGESTHFRVWAPKRRAVTVCLDDGGEYRLAPETGGYFAGRVEGARAGMRYRFRLDEEESLYPDPASRFQPEGPHGPSEIVDPNRFSWSDANWPGVKLEGQIAYEMHIGTFTPEGSWRSGERHLEKLKDVGISLIEMMPVAEFPGEFGWGYDGVDLFAPYHHYGTPDDLRHFIDRAHALGLGVILDVVYNHFGPDGCYLRCFAEDYFTQVHDNEWGDALNFDGDNAAGMREFVTTNARYWIEEFHFDGLRLDATQTIHDSSEAHIIRCISEGTRAAAGQRDVVLIAENEEQTTKLVRPVAGGGYGLDALWNDDFHHSAVVAMTGHNPAYYSDHRGAPQEFVSAAKYGFLFQGQRYHWQDKPRGTPALDLPPSQFVLFLENHDQVANSGSGRRMHQLTTPGRWRAFTALTLLLPGTPMLFQGQEFCSSKPFRYFAHHNEELNAAIEKGRREFLTQFPQLASPDIKLPPPGDPDVFAGSILDWSEFERNAEAVSLHRDLIALRRSDSTFAVQNPRSLDGAVIGEQCFVLRFFGLDGDDRLLFVNYGRDLNLTCIAEPLVAPPPGRAWRTLWSSEHPKYGGDGIASFERKHGLLITGHAALVLAPTG
jgi:maltooligosyltrehalose trehalohydrolase